MKKTLSEFKTFIMRGNIIDMAVGVIMGTAFGKIVTSIVQDILMPFIGIILGGINFASLSVTIRSSEIKYGVFIQNVIDFLIIAVCIFAIIKFLAIFTSKKRKEEEEAAKKKAEEEAAKEPEKSEEALLLIEIRDLLKNKD